MSAAANVLKSAIEQQQAIVDQIEVDTEKVREAGARAERELREEQRKLLELKGGLATLQQAGRTYGVEVPE